MFEDILGQLGATDQNTQIVFIILILVAFAIIAIVAAKLYRKSQKNKIEHETSLATVLSSNYNPYNPYNKTSEIIKEPAYKDKRTKLKPMDLSEMPIEKDSGASRFKLNFETMLVATVLATLPLAYLAINNPNLFVLAMLVGLSSTFIIGIAIGIVVSTNFRIKILRKMTKRNYGFVNFVYNRTVIKPVLTNLDKDIIKFQEGIYITSKNNMYRLLDTDDTKLELVFDSIKDQVYFHEGIPSIYFDITDMMPLKFEDRTTAKKEDAFRIPTQAAATLNKEIAVEKAKAMNSFKGRLDIFMIILICISLVLVYLTYQLTSTEEVKMTILKKVSSFVDTLGETLPALQRSVDKLSTQTG